MLCSLSSDTHLDLARIVAIIRLEYPPRILRVRLDAKIIQRGSELGRVDIARAILIVTMED